MKIFKHSFTAFFILILFGCATVTYNSTVLQPGSSANINEYIGFGPFKELLTTYSLKSQHVFVSPVLPKNHLNKFEECYGRIPDNEKKLAFVNATIALTINGHGCHGGLFTNKGLHLNAGSMTDIGGKAFIPYQTLYSDSTTIVPGLGVTFNNSATLDMHVDDDIKKMASVFITARSRSKRSQYQNINDFESTLKISKLPEDVLSFFDNFKNQYYYSYPNIPSKKEISFRRCSFMEASETLYILFDNTFFGTGSCIGAGFTDTGVYFSNPAEANYPGSYFISYDQLLLSDFTPYIGKQWDEVFVYPGLSYYVFEDTPKSFLNILKALRGEVDISNEDAMKFVSNYKKIPAYVPQKKVQQNNTVSKPKVSKPKVEQKKSNKESVWGDIGWALLGLVVAKAIYEEIDDGYSSPSYPSSRGKSSSQYAQELLDRQNKINRQRQKQREKQELLNAIFDVESYDWDGFYDEYGNFVYRCRSVNSGRFANNENCYGKIKDDDRWPTRR